MQCVRCEKDVEKVFEDDGLCPKCHHDRMQALWYQRSKKRVNKGVRIRGERCATCGAPLVGVSANAKYCAECKAKQAKKKPEKQKKSDPVCEYCSKPIEGAHQLRKYHRGCLALHRAEYRAAYYQENREKLISYSSMYQKAHAAKRKEA